MWKKVKEKNLNESMEREKQKIDEKKGKKEKKKAELVIQERILVHLTDLYFFWSQEEGRCEEETE